MALGALRFDRGGKTLSQKSKLRRAKCLMAGIAAVPLVSFATNRATGATTKWWDINDATAGAGGASPAGTWDEGTTSNWSTSSAGSISATTFASGDTAIFSAGTDATGSFIVTVSGTVNPALLEAEEGGTITFTGGTINLTGTGTNIEPGALTTANNFIINSILASPNQIAIVRGSGAGNVVTLGNSNNTFSSGISVSTGNTLKCQVAGVIPSSNTVVVNGGATFDITSSNETIGTFTGGGTVALGTKTLTITTSAGTGFFNGTDITSTSTAGGITIASGIPWGRHFSDGRFAPNVRRCS